MDDGIFMIPAVKDEKTGLYRRDPFSEMLAGGIDPENFYQIGLACIEGEERNIPQGLYWMTEAAKEGCTKAVQYLNRHPELKSQGKIDTKPEHIDNPVPDEAARKKSDRTQKTKIYKEACALIENLQIESLQGTVDEKSKILKAKSLFNQIARYKDSKQKIEQCDIMLDKIAEIERENRIKTEKNDKRKSIIMWICVALFSVIGIIIGVFTSVFLGTIVAVFLISLSGCIIYAKDIQDHYNNKK